MKKKRKKKQMLQTNIKIFITNVYSKYDFYFIVHAVGKYFKIAIK